MGRRLLQGLRVWRWRWRTVPRWVLLLILLPGVGAPRATGLDIVAPQAATVMLDGATPIPVMLPLRWPNRAGGPERLRVVVDFEWPVEGAAAQALYVNYLLDGGRLDLNGHTIATVAETDAERFVRWKRSRLIALVPGQLRFGVNRLVFDLPVPRSGTTVQVPRPLIGPLTLLERHAWWRDFWMTTVPTVTVVGSLFVSFGALTIWTLRRSEVLFGLFGVVTLMWGLRSISFVAETIPAAWWPPWRFLFQASTGGATAAMALFLLRYAGLMDRRLEWAIVVTCAAGPLVTLLSGGMLDAAVTRWWTPLLLLVMAVMLFASVRAVRDQRSLPSWAVLASMVVCGVAGVHDYLIYATPWLDAWLPTWAAQRVLLLHYATNGLLLTIAVTLVHRFVTTLQAYEDLSATLERRVAEREGELARNYERVAELQRERAAYRERERIMQDLHDGLGSRLFTSLSRVERGGLEAGAVAQILRDCIGEMRLALDAQGLGEQGLRRALDQFRERWDPALRDAGVSAEWHVEAPNEALQRPASDVVEILRLLQEALTNVLRHAHARHVQVRLTVDAGTLRLEVADDGRGLPADAHATVHGGGRGLPGMRRRAQRLAGQLDIDSVPGRTRIVLRVPAWRENNALPHSR